MKLLAIDTSSAILSVAAQNGEKIASREETIPRQHAEMIFTLCEQVLAECGLQLNELEAIACGIGPGSFTSLRIGLGVVQGLALGAELPVISISSLLAVAQAATPEAVGTALVCMDARMGEVYTAQCQRSTDGLMQLATKESVSPAEQVNFPAAENWVALGNGFAEYQQRFSTIPTQVISNCWPQATAILELARPMFAAGESDSPSSLIPNYVRDNVAKRSNPKR